MPDNLNPTQIPPWKMPESLASEPAAPNTPPEPPLSPTEPDLPPAAETAPPPSSPLIISVPSPKSRTKIILASVAVFLLLASIPAAVVLVKQRQELRKAAAGECGDRSVGDCWGECRGTDEGEVCCTGPSQWSDWRLTSANSPSCGGTGGEPAKCDNGRQVGDSWPECRGCDEGVVTCKGGANYDWTSVKNPSPNCGPDCGTGGEPNKCDNGKQVGDTWPECRGCTEGVVTCKGRNNYDWTPVKENSSNCPGCGGAAPTPTPKVGGTCQNDLGTCLATCQGAASPGQYQNCFWDGGQVKCDCKCSSVDIAAGRCPSGVWTTVVCGESCGGGGGPGEDTLFCESCGVFSSGWQKITNPSSLQPGSQVFFTTRGSTNRSEGITKAKIKITFNNVAGNWQETTNSQTINGVKWFYIPLVTLQAGSYQVESQVYNPSLGWQ